MDIVPAQHGETLELRLLWQGELQTDHSFGVVTPDGNETSLEESDEGIIVFEPTQPGIMGGWAIRLDDESEGKHKGEQYNGTMHGSTLGPRWTIGDSEE